MEKEKLLRKLKYIRNKTYKKESYEDSYAYIMEKIDELIYDLKMENQNGKRKIK